MNSSLALSPFPIQHPPACHESPGLLQAPFRMRQSRADARNRAPCRRRSSKESRRKCDVSARKSPRVAPHRRGGVGPRGRLRRAAWTQEMKDANSRPASRLRPLRCASPRPGRAELLQCEGRVGALSGQDCVWTRRRSTALPCDVAALFFQLIPFHSPYFAVNLKEREAEGVFPC